MPQQLRIDQLLALLQPGEIVFMAGSAGECVELTQSLREAPQQAAGVHFITSFVPGMNPVNLANAAQQRRMQVFFMQAEFQTARQDGAVDFCPWSYSSIQQWLADTTNRIDTVIVQLSEADAHGTCSLGPSAEFMPVLLQRAVRVLGVINPRIPDLAGAPRLALERLSACARSDSPLRQYDAGRANPVADRIAEHLASLIPNGATLQLGLGKIPNQLCHKLYQHRDLAFHSGMLSDGVLGLAANGALRDYDALVSTVAAGSTAFYSQLPQLKGLRLAGVEYTHDSQTLAGVRGLIAINSALELDVLAQINAEMLDGQYLSGPGGLPDFAQAARRQPDGLSVIALPSSDPSGRHSRIVAQLAAGTPVTVPQHDVDVVVTEQGIARLRGLALDQRVHALISIAHPDHRAALKAQAGQLLRRH